MILPSFTSTLGEADLGFLQLGAVSADVTAQSETINAAMASFAGTLSEATAFHVTINAGMANFAGSVSAGSMYSQTLNAAMAAFAGTLANPSNLSVVLDQNMPLFNATLRATVVPPAPTHCEAVPVQSSAVPLAFLIEPDERAGS